MIFSENRDPPPPARGHAFRDHALSPALQYDHQTKSAERPQAAGHSILPSDQARHQARRNEAPALEPAAQGIGEQAQPVDRSQLEPRDTARELADIGGGG